MIRTAAEPSISGCSTTSCDPSSMISNSHASDSAPAVCGITVFTSIRPTRPELPGLLTPGKSKSTRWPARSIWCGPKRRNTDRLFSRTNTSSRVTLARPSVPQIRHSPWTPGSATANPSGRLMKIPPEYGMSLMAVISKRIVPARPAMLFVKCVRKSLPSCAGTISTATAPSSMTEKPLLASVRVRRAIATVPLHGLILN
mmetsp:Transcript_3408/g.7504  ORF Transcript_3408/g.7504 Transcript_3408/m.7504 type:complete len:200 (-) Transcript_3408:1199-1798(-)